MFRHFRCHLGRVVGHVECTHFLLARSRYWYYEIVVYSRKLTLGGLSIFMGRGTMAQAYALCSVLI
jgi:hypothetical protein